MRLVVFFIVPTAIAFSQRPAERDAFRAKRAQEPSAGAAMSDGGGGSPTAAKGARVKAAWPDSIFPARMPPFELEGALLAPNGDIWVKRTVPSTESRARVDILDAHGVLRRVRHLPPRAKLFALGAASVYVISTDDDGPQTLERYGYPRPEKGAHR